MNTIRYFIAVILSCLMLAACGGGDGSSICVNGALYDETGVPAAGPTMGNVTQLQSC